MSETIDRKLLDYYRDKVCVSYVVSDKNLDEFLARIEKDSGNVVFLAMSVPDYELMAYNTQELKRYISELQEVVVYYRKVTTPQGNK